MNGCCFASRSAALLNNATRDWLTDFAIGDHAVFDGAASTRGGFGAEFRAMIGRYAKAIAVVCFEKLTSLHAGNQAAYGCELSLGYGKQGLMVDVAANYERILCQISEAAVRSGRDARSVKLLAAAKSQSVEAIQLALAAGVTLVGENYVQEAAEKKRQLSAPIEWHMIGHLQRNKAKAAAEMFDVIESLDGLSLARSLNDEGRNRGKTIRAFLEINLGGEDSKSGMTENSLPLLLEELGKLSNLRVEGLMTVPPFKSNPEDVRPYFRALRELKERLNELRIFRMELSELSMGMTHDFTVAIEEGATIVRIGTALFGPRRD